MTPTSLLYAYFTVGIAASLPSLGATWIMVETLKFDASDVANVAMLCSIPWCVKPLIAAISDMTTCCFGFRRRPYVCFFSLCGGVAMLLTPAYATATATAHNFTLCLVATSFCVCIVDVALDGSLMVLVRQESALGSNKQGVSQGHAWSARVAGGALGAGWGGYLFETFGFQTLMATAASFVLVLALVALDVPDGAPAETPRAARVEQYRSPLRCGVVRTTVRSLMSIRNVLGAAVLVGIIPEINTSLFFYMYNNKFEPKVLSLVDVSGSLASLGSLLLYNAVRPGHTLSFGLGVLLSSAAACIGSMLSNESVPWLLEAAAVESVIGNAASILLLMPTITVLGVVSAETKVEATVYSCGLSILNLSGLVSESVASAAMRSLHVNRGDVNNVRVYVAAVALLTLLTLPSACCFPTRDQVAADLAKKKKLRPRIAHPGMRKRVVSDSDSDASDAALTAAETLVRVEPRESDKFAIEFSDDETI
jgi:hypothetical protein